MAIKINADKLLLRLHEEFNRNVSDTYNGGIAAVGLIIGVIKWF